MPSAACAGSLVDFGWPTIQNLETAKEANDNLIGDSVFPEQVEPTGKAEDVPAPEVKKGRTRKAPAAKAEAKPKAPAKGKNTTKAPAKEKPPKKEREVKRVEEVITITDTESVTDILEESGDAVSAAIALLEQGERTDFTLGGVLHHIYSEGLHKAVQGSDGKGFEGKKGFSDFCEKHLGVKYRKAIKYNEIRCLPNPKFCINSIGSIRDYKTHETMHFISSREHVETGRRWLWR